MPEEPSLTGAPSWHAAYPAPRSPAPDKMTRGELLELLKTSEKVAGRDFVLVDLRRNDHEGGTIRGSINLPAQSLYPAIPTFYAMLRAAGVPKVIWYCSSSRGRGARAAGWLRDHIVDSGDSHVIESVILHEGIKGWAQAGGEYVEWMDEYNAAAWATP
ncbi:hypothetical protein L204_105154 [Cryptococcus depauperatus]|nr:hypothetical protein L204_03805 [Cryptococcus depauperatus CBS 7855]